MNGLTLRISGTNSKKIKGSLAYSPIFIHQHRKIGNENVLCEQFNQCDSVDKQLTILRDNLTTHDEPTLRFLVLIFLQTESKHPIKCFLVRYITRNSNMQDAFSKALAEDISSHISVESIDIKINMDFVPRLASCLENFPAGAQAVKHVEINLGQYLRQCLKNCVETLSSMKSLSPTEKNEIFNLVHLTLRLLLYLIQKVNPENSVPLLPIFHSIRYNIKELLFDEDVPMDTKSISGLLLIAMYSLENGPRAWNEILQQNTEKCEFSHFLECEAGRLSLYSALVTAVPVSELSATLVAGESALLVLTNNILAIGEETSSDSIFTLGVTRTLVQISKSLSKTTDRSLGLRLVDALLTFVWCHLEHYMDSVRHLTSQMLTNIVRYCTELKKNGDDQALNNLFATLTSLDKSRRSYYVSLTALTSELGASCILNKLPNVISKLIEALNIQAVQASATTTLETLLQRHSREASTDTVYRSWVKPIISYVTAKNLESAVLNILENLLLQAVKLDDRVIDYLLPCMKQLQEANSDLKCVLMLLRVVRKCSTATTLPQGDGEWKGLVSYELLKIAAVDAVDETRTLSLSLIVESPKTTELFSPQELELVLWYLKYNVNVEAPNFRQLTLSMMKKFIKRLEDSYKVLKRQNIANQEDNDSHYYLKFMESLRELCYGCLIPEVNYSRRHVALQLLVWCESAQLEGYQRSWSAQYVENLLAHLDDSYETNKAFALEVLGACPTELIQNQKQAGLEVQEVLQQASSVKPTDCVTAAYKLRLLTTRLPETILEASDWDGISPAATAEGVRYAVMRLLLGKLRGQLSECMCSVVRAARNAPMYGLLHCMLHQLEHVDANAISSEVSWSTLVEQIVETCIEVNAAVACVVNNSSPEGHLPMDMSGVVVTDHGNSGNVRLEDGHPVTAQMVLLCAWRSVKEVSLVLGSISSRMSIVGEEQEGGTLRQQQLVLMGEHFTKLLAETKHRGAFEQAYVGFTKLLTRLWRCRSPGLHELPRNWLRELMLNIADDDGTGVFSATRRSAGLPFMIQALVTTELEVSEKPKCFEECVRALLRVCGSEAAHARTHARNMLRALVRCSALRQHIAPYVGSALLLALDGFDGTTWEERNSSTLLLSALVVRVFGVPRARDPERLPARNRMTGRVFFLRYPQLYDYMLEKLNEVSSSDESQLLKPSLYPILLLLARLYPSALEGTVSNLKLSCFVGPVVACARSAVLKTRQLAARALLPLVPPAMYLPHIERMLTLLCDRCIKRNFCHGVLLQTTKLLDNKPENLFLGDETAARLRTLLPRSMWMLEYNSAPLFCYLLADEYIKMLNLIVWRFPSLIDEDSIDKVISYLDRLLNAHTQAAVQPGGSICLANAASLYFVLVSKYKCTEHIKDLVYNILGKTTYEVTLSALNYLLILNHELDIEDKLQEHLSSLSQSTNTADIKNDPQYVLTLYKVLRTVKYLECKQKCLKLLSLENNTYKYIIQDEDATDEAIMSKLCYLVETVHDNETHIYLYSLTKFFEGKVKVRCVDGKLVLNAVRVIFSCSSSDNSYSTRKVVAGFLEKNFKQLINLELNDLSEEDRFEAQATLWAILVTVLEDDEEVLRQAGARIAAGLGPVAVPAGATVGAHAAEQLRAYVSARCRDGALLCLLGLLDFGGQVPIDEDDDECRVFEQSERYNVFAEGGAWAAECARAVRRTFGLDALLRVRNVLHAPHYARALSTLCGENSNGLAALIDGCALTTATKAELFMRELNR